MRYMLDTDTCIYIMKHQPASVREKLEPVPVGDVAISAVVLAELQFGIACSRQKVKNQRALNDFLQFCTVRDWPKGAANVYGGIRAALKASGRMIGANDLFIAAHAIHTQSVLVTHNSREFDRVPGLRITDWA